VGPHFGEEPPLVGSHGSGTIFFSSCNLKCLYCQNFEISQSRFGHPVSIRQLALHMLWLQELGCHNVNLVTPTHFCPQIVEALALAVQGGLMIPIVYNCGGYESVHTLRMLEDIVDIYMPDIKYSDDENARTYSGVKHYWGVVQAAVKEMHRQVGDLECDEHGVARRGLLLRHLVLPNGIAGSTRVVDFVRDEISPHSYINIMGQYRPAYRAGRYGVLNRRPTSSEYNRVVNHAAARGLHRGFKEGEHVLFSQN
jgi:putative pyruvate formate lyase activating enzyme